MNQKILIPAIVILAILPASDLMSGNIASLDEKAPSALVIQSERSWPASVSVIVNPAARIGDRLKAVKVLGENLNKDEIAALYAFLKSPPDSREKNILAMHALKNNVLNALQDQIIAPPALPRLMIEMYRNHTQDAVIRDYAVQHLATWYQRGAGNDPQAKEQIRRVLDEALRENTSIAGTALLGLHRISRCDSYIRDHYINESALRLTVSSDTDLDTRISAIQVCAERGVTKALPMISDLAGTAMSTALRISAIGALGRMGGPECLATLQKLLSDSQPAVRSAASAAIKRNKRLIASRGPF